MSKNYVYKNCKSKLILVLVMIAVLCFSLFSVACNQNKTTSTRPSYSYTETENGNIKNQSFISDARETALTSFPKTSTSGWSLSTDSHSSINKSLAKSGSVNLSDDGWTELMKTFYKDSAILDYVFWANTHLDTNLNKVIKSRDDVKSAIRIVKGDTSYAPTDAEIQEYTVDNCIKKVFENPKTHDGADVNDKVVYMINNYCASTYIQLGSAQKITSETKILLEKGKSAKFSVWLNTQQLDETSSNQGANIRITNKFNDIEQAEYAINNIDTFGKWEKIEIYVQADARYDCTFNISLGLGYGLASVTRGTVFFDDISYEEVETVPPIDNNLIKNFAFNGKDKIIIDGSEVVLANADNKPVLYSLSMSDSFNSSLDEVTWTANGNVDFQSPFTTDSNQGTISKISLDQENSPYGYGVSATKIENIKNARLALSYDSFNQLDCKTYTYLSFYVKNELSKFGNSDVTVNVYDMLDGKTDIISRNVASASNISDDWQHIELIIRNNFANDNNAETDYDTARKFKIEVIIGPAITSTAIYKDHYASGTVTITTPQVMTGDIYNSKDDVPTADAEKYELFSMFSNSVQSTISLYAGLISENLGSDVTTYPFAVAPSNVGEILNQPTVAKEYQGIVANHIYVKEPDDNQTLSTEINTRTNGYNGNYAGLINTDYLDNYNIINLKEKLAFTATKEEKSIQPLMIYNATADNYGFISKSYKIASSSFVKVSVTLRVVDSAKANVYLVDTTNKSKSVLTLDSFIDTNNVEHKSNDLQFALNITSNDMAQNGWLTAEFFIATGREEKNFRVEVWNGARDGLDASKSTGFVFIKEIKLTSSDAFKEPERKEDAFTVPENPLYDEKIVNNQSFDCLYAYEQQLTELEKQFNSEQKSSADKVSYRANYVWAKNNSMIYGIYRTITPVEVDPYPSDTDKDNSSNGCTAQTDPSTFWMSFSSILLAVALVVAIIMLIIKNVRRRMKANASDAKSHFTITSRIKGKKAKTVNKNNVDTDEDDEEIEQSDFEQQTEEEIQEEQTDDNLDNAEENSYIYGDVQIFGEDDKKQD